MRTHNEHLLLLLAAALLLAEFAIRPAWTQELIYPAPAESPVPAPLPAAPLRPAAGTPSLLPREPRETEAETIAKCLRDLGSQEVTQRRRAVLILGKYAAPAAQAAILRCLQDPDDTVRQSALVALTENEFMPPAAREPVLKLLADPNPSIRRIASSSLREALVPIFRILPPEAVNLRLPAGAPQFTPESKALLNQALEDPDPIVRKNILTLAPLLAEVLEAAPLRRNLNHEDREIRVLALRACEMLPTTTPETLLPLVMPLTADREAVVREAAARSLLRCGESARTLLLQLAADPDPGVKIAALEGLSQLHDKTAVDKCGALLRDESIPLDAKRRLLMLLPGLGESGLQLLLDLARKSTPQLQTEAVRQLSYQAPVLVPVALFLEFLDSPVKELRVAAGVGLMRQAAAVKAETVAALCASTYADVRLTGSQLIDRLPAEKAAAVIGDFVLDDAVEVRTAGLRLVALRQIPGGETILRQSLEDSNPLIRRAAAAALLLRPTPEHRQLLENLLKQTTDAELKAYLQQRLQSLNPAVAPARLQPRPAAPRRPVPKP